MPIITARIVKGRSCEQKAALIRELAEGTMRALDVPEASIRVILSEVDAAHWGVGTKSKAIIEQGIEE